VYRDQLGAEPARHLTGKIKGFVGVIGAIEGDQNPLDHDSLCPFQATSPKCRRSVVSKAKADRLPEVVQQLNDQPEFIAQISIRHPAGSSLTWINAAAANASN
jgi:hypothetical protein